MKQQSEFEIISYDDLSRRDMRSLVFHLLYAAEAYEYDLSISALVDIFNRGYYLNIPIDGELVQLVQAIVDQRDALDDTYKPFLDNWRFERVSVCTKLILRYAVWELTNTDLDINIVMNEAIELAKCFAEDDAYRFINGILDRVVKSKND